MAWHKGAWWPLYVPQWYSPHVSENLFDPYSFTHILHGVLLYYLWALLGISSSSGLYVMFAFEFTWELVENSEKAIKRYRQSSGTSKLYKGDSYQNIIGDLISCEIGYCLSWMFNVLGKPWLSFVTYLIIEIGLLLYMRDSLTITVATLIFPNEKISNWQEEGVKKAIEAEKKQ